MLDSVQHYAPRGHWILRDFCGTQCCFVMLSGAKCNGRHDGVGVFSRVGCSGAIPTSTSLVMGRSESFRAYRRGDVEFRAPKEKASLRLATAALPKSALKVRAPTPLTSGTQLERAPLICSRYSATEMICCARVSQRMYFRAL